MFKSLAIVLACFSGLFSLSRTCCSQEPAVISIVSPQPREVVQRCGFPAGINSAIPEHPLGYADVAVDCQHVPQIDGEAWEYRLYDARQPQDNSATWLPVRSISLRTFHAAELVIRVAAGGWYGLQVRLRQGDREVARGLVESFGVGEVFLIAGQSYATNCNDEPLRVADSQARVVAWSHRESAWNTAHDPQPCVDGSTAGSIWPPVGDALCEKYGVPVAFANVAVGGSWTGQWLPGEAFHQRLMDIGRRLGGMRAVLWQQGESDVLAGTTTANYVANVVAIRDAAAQGLLSQPLWLLAKSTHHPTVYNDPVREEVIRAGIDQLLQKPGFRAGPDTDTLQGENRGGIASMQHFTEIGQRRAAALWVEALHAVIHSTRPEYPTSARFVGNEQLWQPVWRTATVQRESSVLLQATPQGPAVARLAYPAQRVLEVVPATAPQSAIPSASYTLAEDGLSISFAGAAPVPPIAIADLFLPTDAPHSYRHRAGHPEQNMLYRPGRWFHDHNVEVTYERRSLGTVIDSPRTALPRTRKKLLAREPLTMAVSGDSISTGADASFISMASPQQPGYVELVAAQLQATYDSPITLKNRAVGGWSVANGVVDLDQLLAEKPDLVLVAYGMNDVGRQDPGWFHEQTRIIIERIQQANPETEIVLVAGMLGNKEWVHTPRAMFDAYRNELVKLTSDKVALADVTSVWSELLTHKHDHDLTGNGLNHPNDFGHRLYAQAVISLLAP